MHNNTRTVDTHTFKIETIFTAAKLTIYFVVLYYGYQILCYTAIKLMSISRRSFPCEINKCLSHVHLGFASNLL